MCKRADLTIRGEFLATIKIDGLARACKLFIS